MKIFDSGKSINVIFYFFILVGVFLSIINLLFNRSLWLDEAMLALNIVNRTYYELLFPLDFNQVSPIGFLFLEKFFSQININSDLSLRIFPSITFILSIILIYSVSLNITKLKTLALFVSSFFSLTYINIYYSAEVKQYMPETFVYLLLLWSVLSLIQNPNLKNTIILIGTGIISILLSHSSIFLLFTLGIYLLYILYTKKKDFLKIILILLSWILFFILYYFSFIEDHPIESAMLKYWENSNGFFPDEIFSLEFLISLYQKINTFFYLAGYHLYSIILFPFFCVGIYFLYQKKPGYLFILIFPLFVHLSLSYLKLYPFSLRLILYQTPVLLILMLYGAYHVIYFLINRFHRHFLYLMIIPLITNLVVIGLKGYPFEREEIKKSMTHLNKEIRSGEKVYIYFASHPAFSFYISGYSNIKNLDEKNIIIGNANKKNPTNYLTDIKKIDGNVIWLLFSHVMKGKDEINREDYILKGFIFNGYRIIDEQIYTGSSVYKLSL